MNLLQYLLELIYPSRANCMGCGSLIGADEGWLCDECRAWLVPADQLSHRRCQRCGRPIGNRARCRACHHWPPDSIDRARFAHPYRRPIDGVIRRMKYGGVHRLTPQMGTWITNMLLQGQLPPADVIVPVPMHAKRLRERGYNHAALLAKAVADQLGIEYMEPLTRVRHTKQQALLNWKGREGNMNGAFSSSDEIRGLRILLIDDVLTSGATAAHCAIALKKAGAEAVYVATLAGAVD